MGLTLGIIAAPCIGPVVLGLLAYVGKIGNPLLGFLYFFSLSIGMGLPLCLLGIFSGAIDRLPRSGEWMLWIKKLLGWVLIGMAVYIISPLVSSDIIESFLYAAAALSAGIHLGLIDRSGKTLGRFGLFKKTASILIIVLGIAYMVSNLSEGEGIGWIQYESDLSALIKGQKKPLILDFYADWCLPCKELDEKVFSDPEIVRISDRFINMRLDLTIHKPFQDEILRRYGIKGVPTVLFFNKEGIEIREMRIESVISGDEFKRRMLKILDPLNQP